MSYFQAVRIYSLVEVCIFTSLLVVAIGGLGESGGGAGGGAPGGGGGVVGEGGGGGRRRGCRRGIFPWTLLAATVSPLGPIGSTAGLEYLARQRRRVP